ncbi:hypothetical protein GLOIN_2v1559630 [Rhizophagus irregularis DAOM 181602=DAOM 197198]|uniref:Uncharacterized protein n=1 Tax=Rhizophagus irregularis (strain DAOM 181602 / DAOM 197198 / MUCL 43194) TaxID=747089 RepID=A0A2P4QEK8_RHIID|nr:hypothetical protein GLOIN_2v1559630 [Rhizophagus irregularis DAOM 181602=DAOM 197198]POG76056.1 hypothetical protein GLOIN_2v1559630 [Rhizophagus irregularis DAOM 181602=DAOM 197198]|eukprot:XP_025182922.1 hypothetical protein GLOIN_2v1559630 [Rhizophagus irregularis DAOM 181602=DAOM 197198]
MTIITPILLSINFHAYDFSVVPSKFGLLRLLSHLIVNLNLIFNFFDPDRFLIVI